MKILFATILLLDVLLVYSHHAIKILMSRETTKYNFHKICGFKHMQSVVNAFKGHAAMTIRNKRVFCKHCGKRNEYKVKYTHHPVGSDSDVQAIMNEVMEVTSALDIICPEWDETLRAMDADETMKWVAARKEMNAMPQCIALSENLILDYGKQGKVDRMRLMTHVAAVLKDPKLRLGWAAIEADFKSQDECYLNSCFRVVNALTYFKPEVCSHGSFSSVLENICPEACSKVERRLVETGINDCCDDCFGDISGLNESEKDLIDIHPFKSWKEII